MSKHDEPQQPGNPLDDGYRPGTKPPGPAEPGKHSEERKGGKGGGKDDK